MKEVDTSVVVNDASVDHLRGYQFVGGATHRAAEAWIVAISSFVAHRVTPDATFPASAAAEAALEALVRCLAIELASSGATANVVVPGYTLKDVGRSGALDTQSWQTAAKANPLAPLAEPDQVAALVAFPLSPEPGTSREPCCQSMAARS
jgi:3-oxoacyl-[acyl-carrier protein] reductase